MVLRLLWNAAHNSPLYGNKVQQGSRNSPQNRNFVDDNLIHRNIRNRNSWNGVPFEQRHSSWRRFCRHRFRRRKNLRTGNGRSRVQRIDVKNVSGIHCGTFFVRNSCSFNVDGGLSTAFRIIGNRTRHIQRSYKKRRQRQNRASCKQNIRICRRTDWTCARTKSEQFNFRTRIICVVRIRRNIRTSCASCSVLERSYGKRCNRRTHFRRNNRCNMALP